MIQLLLVVLAATTAVTVLAAAIARPRSGLLALALLLPFDGLLLVTPLPRSVGVWKEVLVAACLVGALRERVQRGPGRPIPDWLRWLLGLAGIAVISSVLADRSLVQTGVGLKVTFFGAGMGVVAWMCPMGERERDRLVSIFAGVGAVVAAVGVAQQVAGPVRLHELGYEYNSAIRFSGSLMRSWSTFNQPFPFAYYLMVVVLFCGAVALSEPSRVRNRLILLCMPLYAAGLAFSVVKGAWLALAAGLVYLALRRYRILLHAAPAVAVAAVASLILGLGSFLISDSLFARFDRWTELPAALVDEPWGHGAGAAGAAGAAAETIEGGRGSTVEGRAGATLVVYQPDNQYVKIAYELGVVGLVVFVHALVAAYGAAVAATSRPGEEGLGDGVAAVVVAAGVASIGATLFEIFPLDYLIWLLVGTASVVEPTRSRESERAAAVTRP